MPLKVSSQGWVKVPPPKRPRPPPVDPEEQLENFCGPLRYFACQALDPSRERLRMLGGREGFSSSEADLLRPHSRLERSSTLDEWRFDAQPSRSSSRQSGGVFGSGSPPKHEHDYENPNGRGSPKHRDAEASLSNQPHARRKDRASSTPVIINASPTPSVWNTAEKSSRNKKDADSFPDGASVAYSETPSERNCRRNHRHGQHRKAPSVIPEEDEHERASVKSDTYSLYSMKDEAPFPVPRSTPAPSIARSDTLRTRRTETDIPVPPTIPEEPTLAPAPAPTASLEPIQPSKGTASHAPSEVSEKSERSRTSEKSSRSERSQRSAKSSHSSASSGTSTTSSSRRSNTETESSYAQSDRSASPIRSHRDKYFRKENRHDRYYDDEDTSSYYPSPPASPPPDIRRSRPEPKYHGSETHPRSYRDRAVTAPIAASRPSPALSASTWSSKSSSLSSRSSAPSMDGYQFQAAIFQPKSNYRGYRAPSLSKGNRWETATSALSFD